MSGDIITISPALSGVNYVWQDGSTGQTFNATQAGTIILTISNSCGAVSDTMIITESTNEPQVDLGPDILECEGTVVTLNSGISGVSYLWQDGSTTPDYQTDISGTFILQVSNSCGMDQDTIDVEISGVAPQPDLGLDTLLCEGEILLLNANPEVGTSVVWQDGSTSLTYVVTGSGIYSLAASNRCGTAHDTIHVSYEASPASFDFGPDTLLCPGESILLNAPQTNVTITWQDGSHGISMVADQAQLYTLELSNDCGTSADELLVSIDERMPLVDIEPLPWCEGDVITLDVTQSFIANYLWSDGAVTPVILVDAPGNYHVEVSTDCQSVQEDIEVFPGDDCKNDVFIPTVFSPNGDGINDIFSLGFGSDIQVISTYGTIYDRWGNLVFNSQVNPFTWNGYFAGEAVMPGVYLYTIQLTYLSQGTERKKDLVGDVTVVK
jgi:gliding motility-associated-like protein